jgi:predicted phosphodiesterase
VSNKNLQNFGENLLAAPTSVTGSEAERARVYLRKARALAAAERLKAEKKKGSPTPEQLLADIIRVAEDKETNPIGYKFSSITARRYELYGHYPLQYVHDEWGQFSLALEIAGIKDKAGTRAKNKAIAENSRREHAGRYLKQCVRPYVLTDPVFTRSLVGDKLVLVISDTHATYLDPFTWWSFLGTCRALKPDVVVLNGDILEGSAISAYPKIPGATLDLQVEFDFARSMFEQLRELCGPDTELIWCAGNHGLDRLAKYLSSQASGFAGLRSLRFDVLCGLNDLGVRLAQGGSLCSPQGTELHDPGLLLYNFFYVRHGVKLGKTPAMAELEAAAMSGTTGHVHRASVAYGTSMAHKALSHMSTPMGCSELAGKAYMKGPTTGWQRGFGIVHLLAGGKVHQYPVVTDGGVCVAEGHVFSKTRDIKPQDTQVNWLANFTLP